MRIELVGVPGCPNLDATRRELRIALRELRLDHPIVEYLGPYPSPAVVVDGLDVSTGLPLRVGACCRLRAPTRVQIITALAARKIQPPA